MKIVVLLLAILVNCAHQSPRSQGGNNYGIFGGRNAADGQFPYQASVLVCRKHIPSPTLDCEQLCGAALISPSWFITGAQCYSEKTNYNDINMDVAIGYIDSSKVSNFLRRTIRTFVHEDYVEGEEPSNDIRLYQLSGPLKLTPLIQPIKLPKPNSNFIGEVVATGWGYTSIADQIKDTIPDILQYQVSNMPDGARCADLAKAANLKSFSVTKHVCTENPENNQGICGGDIGGPLVQNGTLVGISSWQFIPCGQKGVPSVYTKVSNYIDWITERVTEPLIFD